MEMVLSLNQAIVQSQVQVLFRDPHDVDRVVAYGTPARDGSGIFVTMCAPYVAVTGFLPKDADISHWVHLEVNQPYNADHFAPVPERSLWLRADGAKSVGGTHGP